MVPSQGVEVPIFQWNLGADGGGGGGGGAGGGDEMSTRKLKYSLRLPVSQPALLPVTPLVIGPTAIAGGKRLDIYALAGTGFDPLCW